MIKSQAAPTAVDYLLAMRNEISDRQLVLQGAFTDEIKRLTAIRIRLVDREHGPRFELARVLHLHRPLIPEAELQVFKPLLPVE